ncbi:NADP-dependent oxidoreductase [Sphingomonas bacterium]|uniref:NADP-dependent oxidoreductase n=1 Tax=Sphingomonas bacterium TaxID=1895847 RepID=UPI001575E92A|nr:NADP-dependent oxidoreductase [Sphingomonas bacterium]
MKAVLIDGYGDADLLRLGEAPTPDPGPGELLVRVGAIAVNPADWKWRVGMFRAHNPFTFPHILGYDVAGTVVGGDALPAGTRVVASLDPVRQGAYAEYVVVAPNHYARLPDALDFARAAALPTAGLTGVQLVEESLDVKAGTRLLITGATGAVGRFAVHAAKRRGAWVVGAVRSPYRAAAAEIGVDEVIGFDDGEAVAAVDMVADTVGGALASSLFGRIAADATIHTVATDPILVDGLAARPLFYAVHADGARLAELARALSDGALEVPIAVTLPLARAAEAHRLIEGGGIGGKIILEPEA